MKKHIEAKETIVFHGTSTGIKIGWAGRSSVDPEEALEFAIEILCHVRAIKSKH